MRFPLKLFAVLIHSVFQKSQDLPDISVKIDNLRRLFSFKRTECLTSRTIVPNNNFLSPKYTGISKQSVSFEFLK